jgi:hypothetical protein
LRDIAAGREPVCARAVIPLLVPLQFLLEAQLLDVELFGAEFVFLGETGLLFGAELLFFGALLLAVALQEQRAHHCFQRCAVLG